MAQKFDRRYKLVVDLDPRSSPPGADKATIELPFTCEFTVTRQTLASGQTATIRIFNLKDQTRNALYKDPFDTTVIRYLQFFAGYADFMPQVFYGLIQQAISWRDGVNTITEFTCNSMEFAAPNAQVDLTVAPGATAAQILALLNQRLPGFSTQPVIGRFPAVFPRATVLSGGVWQIVQQVSNGLAIVDNNRLIALNDNEAVANASIPLLNAASGILGTPKRGQQGVEVSMIFEPRLTLQQVVQLQSTFNPIFDGTYKVQGFKHAGTISPRVCGNCQTECTLFRPGIGPGIGPANFTIINET